ncbi:LysR family transcriptional regulator [Streptomyces sp. TRM 70361]|uniref:LysR family transcriptional regulator n=1 Tax=Streptomyces sp. TRM 70361 TaxID=3116553 RepID=UPI002E7C2703|nr:LysR family transcriptional regulator [Streptomyces sp. TRM 70361]MEE1942761.1 LysR family transcriptional regulator [Streptomyces sp. TRM 70361]
MDTPQLEAFLAVVDIGSFTRAAARLGLSQPTVTNRIKALEQALGTVLLKRLPGGVTPTPAGGELLPYAREIVSLTNRARCLVESGGQLRGRVDVGTPESLANHRLLPLIEYVYLRYPGIEISMRSPADGDVVAQVRAGRFDCAFFVDRLRGPEDAEADVETEVLCPEPLVLVAGRDHPLADRTMVTDEDLRGATLVRSDNGAGCHLGLERLLASSRGREPERLRVFELDSADAARRSVANGIGVALVPRVAVEAELASGELRQVDWSPPFETFTQVVRRRNTLPNPALDALVEAAAQVVEEQLADCLPALPVPGADASGTVGTRPSRPCRPTAGHHGSRPCAGGRTPPARAAVP